MKEAIIQVRHWSDSELLTEAAIWRVLSVEGLHPYAWSNGPGEVYGAHHHAYHKVIVVGEGSITFGFPEEGRHVTLNVGGQLDLPPRVVHDVVVGSCGVVCLEAHCS